MEGIIIEGDDCNTFSLGQVLSCLERYASRGGCGKQVDTLNLKEREVCAGATVKTGGLKEQVSPKGRAGFS